MNDFAQAVGALAPSSGVRQAALLLHTMPEADRHWLLQQLPEPQRTDAQQLLVELAMLGIPADVRLLDEVVATASADAPSTSSGGKEADARVARLARCAPRTITALLQAENDSTVARLLRLSAWPWRDAVLDQLGPTRRRRIQGHMADAAGGGRALDVALLDALFAAVARQGEPVPPRSVSRASWSARWRTMWKDNR